MISRRIAECLTALVSASLTCALATAADVPASQSRQSVVPTDANWSLRLPKDELVTYQGVVSFDGAGLQQQSMLYPAPNLAGLLVGILTHGVIVDDARSKQRKKIQDDADRVLLPYHPVLRDFRHTELMQQGIEKTAIGGRRKLVEFSEKPGADYFVESLPLFSLAQDQSAIILDNVVAIYAPNAPSAPAYQNIVRVVSRAENRTDLFSFWMDNNGEKLKAESARLFAESLDLAWGEMAYGPDKSDRVHRTIRYTEGTLRKMERGQIVSERCDRVVLRNLRGWVMSVPVDPGAAATAAPCDVSTK